MGPTDQVMAAQAGPMAGHIPGGQMGGGVFIHHLETGPPLADGGIPGGLAHIAHHGPEHGGKGLGIGGNVKIGLGRHATAGGGIGQAKGLLEDGLAILDHHNGTAGHTVMGSHLLHGFFQNGMHGDSSCQDDSYLGYTTNRPRPATERWQTKRKSTDFHQCFLSRINHQRSP